jgi:hypothetical protein
MSADDMAPPGYGIYPVEGTVPEFRIYQKADGTIEQHVRYVNKIVGYTGKWMVVQTVKEEPDGNTSNTTA